MSVLAALPSAFVEAVTRALTETFPSEQILAVSTDRTDWLVDVDQSAAVEVTDILLGNAVLEPRHLDYFPNLRHVQRWGSGTDNVDVSDLAKRRITFASAPGANASSVAEHFWALTLSAARQIVSGAALLRGGVWPQQVVAENLRDIDGASVGLVGYGSIGTRVAEIGWALGARVIYATRTERQSARSETRFRREPLREVLKCNIVGVVCDLNPSTWQLLNERTLQFLRTDAILVNVARGAIVDERALLRLLEAGQGPACYAADVLSSEPFRSELIAHPRVVLSPHIAGRSPRALRAVTDQSIAALVKARQRFTQKEQQ